jgi:CubicO group peptidase (beta-lactamase class C family)
MSRSSVTLEALQNDDNYALGYGLENEKIVRYDYVDMHDVSPAGAINSSANEMSNWVIAWLNKGKFKGKQIIPKKYIKEAISSQAVIYGHLPSKNSLNTIFLTTVMHGSFHHTGDIIKLSMGEILMDFQLM